MNAKLTPWLLIIGLIVLTAIGPLTKLKDIQQHPIDQATGLPTTSSNLTNQEYWVNVGETSIASFATGALAEITLVATTLGIPLVRGATSVSATSQTESGGGSSASGVGNAPPST